MLRLRIVDPADGTEGLRSFSDGLELRQAALEALQRGYLVQVVGAHLGRPRMTDIDSCRPIAQRSGVAVERA